MRVATLVTRWASTMYPDNLDQLPHRLAENKNRTLSVKLTKEIAELMTERGRRLLLFGRKRMGKTSLIREAAAKAHSVLIYCDIATVAGMNEVALRLLGAAPQTRGPKLAEVLKIAVEYLGSGVGVKMGKVILTGGLRPDDGDATVEAVLNFLNACAAAADEAWTVCLDEVQELYALGGPRIDWRLRGLMQGHRNLNYIIIASDYRVIGRLAGPTGPFYKQLHQMEVGPVPAPDLSQWIERRAKTAGRHDFPYGDQIVAAAGPCTGDVVRLTQVVFSLSEGRAPRDIVSTAFDSIALGERHECFLHHWRSFSTSQRGILRAIAAGEPPTASATLRTYGLRAASTAASAVGALVKRRFLVRTETGVGFDDPFFRRWVEFHRG